MNEQDIESRFEFLKGDKVLWMVIIVISIFSIFPVYSASSNLEYIVNNGTTTGHVIKHMFFVVLGLGIMRLVGTVKYEYIGKLSSILLGLMIILLIITMFTGQTIDGASASRWLKIPGTPISFQPSSFAFLMLIIYLCRYLTKKITRERLPIENITYIFGPILLVFVLVAKDNGSTALMILMVSVVVLIIGQLHWKYIAGFISSSFVAIVLFLIIALNTNLIGGNRVHTWMSRIETFTSSKAKSADVDDESVKSKKLSGNAGKSRHRSRWNYRNGTRKKRFEANASTISFRFYFCRNCGRIRGYWCSISHKYVSHYDYQNCNDCQYKCPLFSDRCSCSVLV